MKKAIMVALVALVGIMQAGCLTLQRLGITEDIVVSGVELALKRQGLEGTVSREQMREIIDIVRADKRLNEIGEEIAAQDRVQQRISELVERYVVDGAVVEPSEKPVVQTQGDYTPQAGESNTGIWKPISDSDKKLVVLLPCTLSVSEVKVVTAQGNTEIGNILVGRYNGNRKHARFDYPGSAYGSGPRVVATLVDGTMKAWTINHGGTRQDFEL